MIYFTESINIKVSSVLLAFFSPSCLKATDEEARKTLLAVGCKAEKKSVRCTSVTPLIALRACEENCRNKKSTLSSSPLFSKRLISYSERHMLTRKERMSEKYACWLLPGHLECEPARFAFFFTAIYMTLVVYCFSGIKMLMHRKHNLLQLRFFMLRATMPVAYRQCHREDFAFCACLLVSGQA